MRRNLMDKIPDLSKFDSGSEWVRKCLRLEVALSVAHSDNFHVGKRRMNSRMAHAKCLNLNDANEEDLKNYYYRLYRKYIGGSKHE